MSNKSMRGGLAGEIVSAGLWAVLRAVCERVFTKGQLGSPLSSGLMGRVD